MKKVLILGHAGMLGNAVKQQLLNEGVYTVSTTSERWPSESFMQFVTKADVDVIINCIGKIPQSNQSTVEYEEVNEKLPIFLDSIGVLVIHPSTDCEFSGSLELEKRYMKNAERDAVDVYGLSKARVSQWIEAHGRHTKIIRTSIIGHEKETHFGLLEWFLHQSGEVNGYTDHYWNGITTLQWIKVARQIIDCPTDWPVLNQVSCEACVSKYEVLQLCKEVYGKQDVHINPVETGQGINKCLASDILVPDLKTQLLELKNFYNR